MRERLLAAVAGTRAAYSDIRFQRYWTTTIASRGRRLELVTQSSGAVGLARSLVPGQGWGAVSFSAPDDCATAIRQALELSLAAHCHPAPVLAPVAPREGVIACPPGRDPRALSLTTRFEIHQAAVGGLFGADRRIVDARVRYQDALVETWFVNSAGACLCEFRPELTLSVLAVAEEEGSTERAVASVALPGTWEELEGWVAEVRQVAARAVRALQAVPVQPARLPVVLGPGAAGILAHRAVGHGCEADGGAPLPVGTRIGPDLLSIGDDGTALGLRGTLSFDFEGASPQNTTLVRNGVVVGQVHTRATAARAGTRPTGNARAAGAGTPRARLTNTYVANGRGTLEDLLRDIPLGVYVADAVGASLDGGEIGLRAGPARMIRRGELAEEVKGVVLSGNALALLGQVDRVAGDFAWDLSASRCARGEDDEVPVSVGAPHLRLLEAAIGSGA